MRRQRRKERRRIVDRGRFREGPGDIGIDPRDDPAIRPDDAERDAGRMDGYARRRQRLELRFRHRVQMRCQNTDPCPRTRAIRLPHRSGSKNPRRRIIPNRDEQDSSPFVVRSIATEAFLA